MNSLKRINIKFLWQPLKYQFRNRGGRRPGLGNIEGKCFQKPLEKMEKIIMNSQKYRERMAKSEIKTLGVSNNPKIYLKTKPRMANLNAIFTESVIEILTIGKLGKLLEPFQLKFTQVKLAPNYRTAGIYWIGPHLDESKKMDLIRLFSSIAIPFREEMIKRHLISNTPHFNFVEDIYELRRLELEYHMEVADYGPDNGFTPDPQCEEFWEQDLQPEKNPNLSTLNQAKILDKVDGRRLPGSGVYHLSTIVDYEALHPPCNRPMPPAPSANPDFSEDHKRVAAIQTLILEKKREKYQMMKDEDKHQERLYKIHEESQPDTDYDIEAPSWTYQPPEDQYIEEENEDIEEFEEFDEPQPSQRDID